MAPKSGTTDSLASYMTTGYYRDEGVPPRHWDTASSNVITVNLGGLTAEGRALARAALDSWEMVANIQFQETTGRADITFDDSASGANTKTTYDPSNGNLISANVNIGTDWLSQYGTAVGGYSFQTYIHEIGHALGIGHPGPYDGGATYANATWTNDSWQQTVMSYLDQDENPNIRAGKAYVVTPMMADIVAVQSLYGAPRSGATAGDTTWGGDSTVGNYMTSFFGSGPGDMARNALTIFDQGGVDTLNVAADSRNQVINLNSGTFSSTHGQIDNVAIARNATIENASAGSGSDSVTGNAAANLLRGSAGNDTLNSGAGNDSLYGGDGNDQLLGGSSADRLWGDAGSDRLDGGSESDTLYGGSGNDSLSGQAGGESLYGGDGVDLLSGGDNRDWLWGDASGDTVQGGNGSDTLFGGSGNDQLTADAGNDTLDGGSGNDYVSGGTGNDRLTGGSEADSFVFRGGQDLVVDFQNNVDTIVLDDALWGGVTRTIDAILRLATVTNGDVLFDFGNGNTLRIDNLTSTSLLLDDLSIS